MSSVKRRGDRRWLEWKVRVGRVELVQCGATIGFAEQWVKQRLDDVPSELARGPWLDVDKRIWRIDGFEIARLTVAGTRWWTVAVRAEVDASAGPALPPACIGALSIVGTAHSYASWLTEWCRDQNTSRAAA